ncbi:LLM class flavin-dependent oxidoreductase [Humidisolicoccus flavus]|uniref:LLM class flavin-dependent oxidoreductase n=1 Tax=Humidisolicoccus flavus TaxID=3111414 RepID=UPI0032564016
MASPTSAESEHVQAPTSTRLSILDLVLISEGDTPADTFQNTFALAESAEQFGYERYWLAEHHLYPGGAGSTSYLLIPELARRTSTLKLGTAVLVIDNYSPVQVTEIGGTLATLTGRPIDLGLGRGGPSVEQREKAKETNAKIASGELEVGPKGAPRVVEGVTLPAFSVLPMRADRAELNDQLLSRTPGNPADFPTQINDVLSYLEGTATSATGEAVTVNPAEGSDVTVWVHGSSPGASAALAGELGLHFGANYHSFPQLTLETVQAYRDAFKPSKYLKEPYVVVSADVLVAATAAEAERIASPFGPWLYRVRTEYAGQPYLSPEDAAAFPWDDERERIVADRTASRIVGDPETVVDRLAALARATGANELVITTTAHTHADRVNSYRLLAEAWERRNESERLAAE